MKLVTFLTDEVPKIGLVTHDYVLDLQDLDPAFPLTMTDFLQNWDTYYPMAKAYAEAISEKDMPLHHAYALSDITLLAPVPRPPSCRDAYAFRQHVETSRRNRGLPMIAEFDQFPVFYFTNHQAIQGPGEVLCMPEHLKQLDFELEVAVVICRQGRNISASEADEYIGGYMIMNDISARSLQMEEMKLNLGPAKGKDFSTVIGPWLVTTDELADYLTPAKAGHTGRAYNLKMTAHINGEQVSVGNLADMDWTFAEIIERCSYGATLYPGDIIGSGTVGTGCFLELNGTAKIADPEHVARWLNIDDQVDLYVEGLGNLHNTIAMETSTHSLRKQKKN